MKAKILIVTVALLGLCFGQSSERSSIGDFLAGDHKTIPFFINGQETYFAINNDKKGYTSKQERMTVMFCWTDNSNRITVSYIQPEKIKFTIIPEDEHPYVKFKWMNGSYDYDVEDVMEDYVYYANFHLQQKYIRFINMNVEIQGTNKLPERDSYSSSY